MHFFRHYFSSIYIEGPWTKLSIFFCCVLREQKEKNKVYILTVYQDAMTFFLLKDPKND